MNHYTIDELKIGMTESFTVQVTEDMQEKFTEVSGDTNPMHLDEEYAKKHGFEGRLVYGMLTGSLYSRLAGVYLPGEHCVLQEVRARFHAPVYIGETLTVMGTVEEQHEAVRTVKIKAVIINENGKKVSSATITALVNE